MEIVFKKRISYAKRKLAVFKINSDSYIDVESESCIFIYRYKIYMYICTHIYIYKIEIQNQVNVCLQPRNPSVSSKEGQGR